jgi:hypothetical protein
VSAMPNEQPDAPAPVDSRRNRRRVRRLQGAGLFTIKEVGDACGLAQPVVAQLVPRTWTDAGWMYTADALAYAVQIAPDVRAGRYVPPPPDYD